MGTIDTTALVTGASSGIGEQFARQLAASGHHLLLVARREPELLALREELVRAHSELRVEVLACDLSEPGAGAAVAAFAAGHDLRVDILVNNAGVGSHDRFIDEDPAVLAAQIQLNCAALVDLTARFLPAMLAAHPTPHGRADPGAAVINIASTAAFQPVPTMAVYGATKAFVLSFSEALWAETRTTGVRVLTVCPGATDTAFFATTGKEFLTRGRQTPEAVVTLALRALRGHRATVVSGRVNRLNSASYRFPPREVLARLSGRLVSAS